MSVNRNPAGTRPIDAVILWVDGNDPDLREKRERYLALENKSVAHPGALPTRFASSNEIRYCVLSILSFAPFVRNIFIVTDGQDPGLDKEVRESFPDKADSLRIIDHTELFRGYEEYLPTFNSSSILAMVWRISGLSEEFIYFNDDTILIRETTVEDWFINGKPVLRGRWLLPPVRKIVGTAWKVLLNKQIRGNSSYRPKISFYIRQWQSARLVGMRWRYFFHCHTAHPMRVSTLENYFSANEALLKDTVSYRFRDAVQLLATSVAYHLEILGGNKNFGRLNLGYFHPWYSGARLNRRISRCMKDPQIKSVCIQSMEMLGSSQRDRLFRWLDSIMRPNHGS